MTRAIDRACELEEIQRQQAIDSHRRRALDEGGDGCCVDCGNPIDPKRLAAQPLAIRCIEHQGDFERRQKALYGRR